MRFCQLGINKFPYKKVCQGRVVASSHVSNMGALSMLFVVKKVEVFLPRLLIGGVLFDSMYSARRASQKMTHDQKN